MNESKFAGIIPAIKHWEGKWRVNEAYRPIAEALVAKFPELEHIPADKILFVDNVEAKPCRKGKFILAQIGLVPEENRVVFALGFEVEQEDGLFKVVAILLSSERVTLDVLETETEAQACIARLSESLKAVYV